MLNYGEIWRPICTRPNLGLHKDVPSKKVAVTYRITRPLLYSFVHVYLDYNCHLYNRYNRYSVLHFKEITVMEITNESTD